MEYLKSLYETIIGVFQSFVDPENGIFKPIKEFFDNLFKKAA